MKQLPIMSLFVLCIQTIASAGSWHFLPGDAYFATELTANMFAGVRSSEVIRAYYAHPWFEEPRFGGSAGYQIAEIKNISNATKDRITALYHKLRKTYPLEVEIHVDSEGKEKRREINGFPLLLYNRTFDFKSMRVGLRYNEDWADDVISFGHSRPFVGYDVANSESLPNYLMLDWRDGKTIPSLEATLPTPRFQDAADKAHTPISLDADKLILIVVADRTIEAIRRNRVGALFFIISASQTIKMYRDTDGWQQAEVIEAR